MGVIKEVIEDVEILNEVVFHNARREYRFKGPNGPIIGINGAGPTGWTRHGQREFMLENKCSGVLMALDYLNTDLNMCLRRLDKEIMIYKNPTLVGYSAGGFLALLWAKIHGFEKINKIITIATPLQGSPKLFSFAGDIVAKTLPGEKLLSEITNLHPPKSKVLSIFASEDKFIPYPDTIRLNWATIIKPDFKAHGEIQNHKEAYEKELKEAIGLQK